MEINNDDLKFNFGCASCGYKNIAETEPLGRIPVSRIIEKLDAFFARNDLKSAGQLLEYWLFEAEKLRDKQGMLTILSEQMGYYRKTNEKEKALVSVKRGVDLIGELGTQDTVASATIFLNAATTLKAFGRANEAIPLYEQTLKIYKSQLKEDDLLFGGFYNNYGLALADLSRFSKSEKAYLSALEVVLGNPAGRLDGAVTYLNMAHLYENWSEKTAEDIADCLQKALEILNDTTIKHDGYYAFVLSKCAPSYQYFGMEEIAEKMSTESEEIYARS